MDPKVMLAALGLPETATIEQLTDFAVAAKKNETAAKASVVSLEASAKAVEVATKALSDEKTETAKVLAAIGVDSASQAIGAIGALRAGREQSDPEGHGKILAALHVDSTAKALGAIGALMDAKGRAESAEAELLALGKKSEASERAEIIAKLEADRKVSPVQLANYIPTLDLEGLKTYAAYALPVLAGDGKREPGKGGYKGKAYADLTYSEKHELANSDPELFAQLRNSAEPTK